MPPDSLGLPSGSICHSDASLAQGHGSKQWHSLLALQGPLDSPLKVWSWKQKVLTCAGPLVCIVKHPLPARWNPCDRPVPWYSGPEAVTGKGLISCDNVAFTLVQCTPLFTWPLHSKGCNPTFSITNFTRPQATFWGPRLTLLAFEQKHQGCRSAYTGWESSSYFSSAARFPIPKRNDKYLQSYLVNLHSLKFCILKVRIVFPYCMSVIHTLSAGCNASFNLHHSDIESNIPTQDASDLWPHHEHQIENI